VQRLSYGEVYFAQNSDIAGLSRQGRVAACPFQRNVDAPPDIGLLVMNPQNAPASARCVITQNDLPMAQLRSYASVRPSVSTLIAQSAPDWGEGKYICLTELARFRRLYVEGLLDQERGELSSLSREVVESLESGRIQEEMPDFETPGSFGERAADRVASFGGSWVFILTFLAVLMGWILLNAVGLMAQPFDPYPFILLNLVLSCVAALQAPVIMMSQRRQETKDRQRSQSDYQVNLKAELEIRMLHEKIDHQLAHQWDKLVEMQQIQIDLLEEYSGRS
jgi:uncharacterized membrane protein